MRPTIDTSLDGHVHTRLCLHAKGEMEEYVQAAIQKGLACLTFLEHLEVGITYPHRTWLTPEDFEEYFREGQRLKQKYRDKIRIRLGVETGYNPEKVEEIRARLEEYPVETVGLSYHFYRIADGHYNMVSKSSFNMKALMEEGAERVATQYFTTLLEAIQALDVSFLCHLDAVLRHMPEMTLTRAHHQQIDALLDTMAARSIGLEINTSGIPHRGMPYPETDIIGRAVRRGIWLQAGSDAHTPTDVGRYFSQLPELIRESFMKP
ncbi:MAG: restriction endonuclease [Desulfobulbus propionicus]|nr:MAG: restriction endonuclease [Desulfobulbus propionicus]